MHLHSLENDPEYINLQIEMVRMQNWLIETGKRLVIICEGRDSAGKGGAIMRFIRFINPRHYRVVALNKPTAQEKGQWYFQRYIQHFPNPGEIVFFDRSWYNRAVVEPVMGFCSQEQYDMFIKQVVQFEDMLVEDGMIIFKLWFSIDRKEQNIRLEERKSNPLISWKLSTVDMQAQLKWDDFTKYKELMFQATGTQKSPWVVIKGNEKDLARKEAMRYVLKNVPYEQKGLTGVRLDYDGDVVTVISKNPNDQ
ncbi:MAG: polyphosphate kinase 2 [Bacteroidetes bacterium]|nr:polyphosphate kinase 2 [Bacteroidota bacterium]